MTPNENAHGPKDNQILAALPADEYERLLPHLEDFHLILGDVLSRPDEPIEYVYFPHRGTISVISTMEDGSQVEAGIVGNEGLFGLPVVLGTDSAPFQATVQIADGASRMRAGVLREEMGRGGRLQKLLLRYGQAFFVQVAQTAVCNRRHNVDGRLARWLLMCQDRALSDELGLTHEFLSIMLGVRRAGVSVAASKLQAQGLIRYAHGRIHILDRAGLEAFSCECYRVVRREFDRLLAA
jgi:CRP-like cAMP-binding protein